MKHFICNMQQLAVKYTHGAVIEYFYDFKTQFTRLLQLYNLKKNTCGNNFNIQSSLQIYFIIICLCSLPMCKTLNVETLSK